MFNIVKSARYSRIKRDNFKYSSTFHPDWTIYIVINGSFECSLFEHKDIIQSGDLYFIPPNISFERKVIEPITVHFIRFTLDESVALPFPMPIGKVILEDMNRLQSTIETMKDMSKISLAEQSEYIKHYLCDILYQYNYESSYILKKQPKINDPLVADVISFFKLNYHMKINMNDIATQFWISPSGLIWKFRKETNILPMRYLINIRIKNAKQLLVNTSVPIFEIAKKTGFENGYYFSKAFKKETGLSPSEYRKTYMI